MGDAEAKEGTEDEVPNKTKIMLAARFRKKNPLPASLNLRVALWKPLTRRGHQIQMPSGMTRLHHLPHSFKSLITSTMVRLPLRTSHSSNSSSSSKEATPGSYREVTLKLKILQQVVRMRNA